MYHSTNIDPTQVRASDIRPSKCEHCGETHPDPDYFGEHKPTGKNLCPDCLSDYLSFDQEQEERNSAVEVFIERGFLSRWYAFADDDSIRGKGYTIQEALSDFLTRNKITNYYWR